MSVPFPGFVGPSYQLENRYASVERLVNWYLVANESQTEEKKFTFAAFPMPGNRPFSVLPTPSPFNHPNRGLIELRGHVYGVNGPSAFELLSNGNFVYLGNVAQQEDPTAPVSMVANGNGQVFIGTGTANGLPNPGYVIPNNGGANSLVEVPIDAFLGCSYATFQDGYILVVTPNSNQFQISGDDIVPIGDATVWNAGNVSIQAGQADYLKTILSSREYVRLMGDRRSQIYQNVGAQGIGGFPFQSYNETFIETGIAAPFSLSDLGDSLIWLGRDNRGARACWRDSAFRPERVSNFAVEQAWQGYSTVEDAVSFPFIWKGNLLWQVTFPTANKTWVYDATVSALVGRHIWYERQHLNANGQLVSRPERTHCYGFGYHLVGSSGTDGNPGAIYRYC